MEHIHDIREELRQPAIELRHEIPEVFRAFESDELARHDFNQIAVLRCLEELVLVHVDQAPFA